MEMIPAMKQPSPDHHWYFVDESGDPTFYDRKGNLIVGQTGCSPILLLGFIETPNPQPIRRAILDLQRQIVADPYFQNFPSLQKTATAFHAKADRPEIRYLFFKLIATLDFKAQFVVARKIERVFRNSFQTNETLFYDHLMASLFKNVLHRYQHNHIYYARRGSRNRQIPLSHAIRQGISQSKKKVQAQFELQAQIGGGEPCLSVVDYMNWAVYRAFTTGEMQYFNVVADKVTLLVDLYDQQNYPNNWYNRRNPFDIKKKSPLCS